MKLKIAVFLFASSQAFASNASTILCNGCSSTKMQDVAKEKARTLRFGMHNIGVLNINGADYNSYQANVSKDYNTGATLVQIQAQKSSSELQIESSAKELLGTIDELQKTLASKIYLPNDTPYKSVTTALSEPVPFSTYATYILRNTPTIQSKVTAMAATIETIAANAQVEASGIVLSINTQLSSGAITMIVFPDGSSLESSISFQNSLVDGIVINVTAGTMALDGEGKLISTSTTQLDNLY